MTEKQDWTAQDELELADANLDNAAEHLDGGKKIEAMTEISLAEFHIKRAVGLDRDHSKAFVIDLRDERVKEVTRRLGWFWRIIKRIL